HGVDICVELATAVRTIEAIPSIIFSYSHYLNSTHSSTKTMELTSCVPATDGLCTHTRSTRSSRY
ncbi:MAG: hypothetical protein ACTSVT_00185, partial [Candidatus Thorarchaeota archaeon]